MLTVYNVPFCKQPETFRMPFLFRFLIVLMMLAATAACSKKKPKKAKKQPPVASRPAAASDIAGQVLQIPQRDDIITSGREAMRDVSQADIDAVQNPPPPGVDDWPPKQHPNIAPLPAAPRRRNGSLPPLPDACERYFQRAAQCYAGQGEFAAELQQMTEEARADVAEGMPDEAACVELNRSFDAVAQNLGCR